MGSVENSANDSRSVLRSGYKSVLILVEFKAISLHPHLKERKYAKCGLHSTTDNLSAVHICYTFFCKMELSTHSNLIWCCVRKGHSVSIQLWIKTFWHHRQAREQCQGILKSILSVQLMFEFRSGCLLHSAGATKCTSCSMGSYSASNGTRLACLCSSFLHMNDVQMQLAQFGVDSQCPSV